MSFNEDVLEWLQATRPEAVEVSNVDTKLTMICSVCIDFVDSDGNRQQEEITGPDLERLSRWFEDKQKREREA